jgi:hypothetical protein
VSVFYQLTDLLLKQELIGVASVYTTIGSWIKSALKKHLNKGNMKKRTDWLVVPIALAISFAVTGATLAEPLLQIDSKFQPDPLVVSGTSGGGEK